VAGKKKVEGPRRQEWLASTRCGTPLVKDEQQAQRHGTSRPFATVAINAHVARGGEEQRGRGARRAWGRRRGGGEEGGVEGGGGLKEDPGGWQAEEGGEARGRCRDGGRERKGDGTRVGVQWVLGGTGPSTFDIARFEYHGCLTCRVG
jgi:hypothetical protein